MIGTTLGPYRLDRELGSGGMGKVYAATVVDRCPGLAEGTRVALKVLHPHLLETPGFFKRFLREAEIGKSVVHENVVRTLDADQLLVGGVPYSFLTMELVEGQTLRGLLQELDRVPEELCRHIGREIAKGLAAIHAVGVVHRDMKPENVLITKEHVVKVMDLGVARLNDEALRLSQTGAFVGSIHYAAPECFTDDGRGVDGRADLHAVGLVLYELSCGTNPYLADGIPQILQRILHEEPRRLGDVNPQLSPFFEEVVHCLLAKKPAERFADANALLRVLREGEASSWWGARAKAIRAVTQRPLRRIRIPRDTAVYGREAEITRLRALYEKAKAGEGQVVLVEGEAGIGKSRVVDELVGRLQREGEDLNFLFGSYPPGGAATAAGAFSTAFREQFGAEGTAAYLPRTPLLVPAFDALLRGDAVPPAAEPLTKDSLPTCFVAATQSLAAERVTVLLIDDLHFATEEGRALFTSLALGVAGHRVLLVGTTRPGADEKWLAGLTRLPHVSRLALSRLGPKDLALLLKESFRSEKLAHALGVQIALKSDGNPFFAFEIIRGLREGQFITQKDDGSWVSTKEIDEIQIPSSVLDLVNARVADLSEAERNLLDVAACWGFEFDPLLVGEVLGMARIPLLRALGQIERQHRLVRSSGLRYVFDHHQVQEALYGSLSELLRREYHAALAHALETRAGAAEKDPATLGGALCVDLCEHYLKGAQGERALRYLDAALTHLEKGYLNDATVRLAQRALAVPGLVAGKARVELLVRTSGCLELLGRKAELRAGAEEAVGLADRLGEVALRAKAHRQLGHVLERAFEHEAATAELTLALGLARDARDRRVEATATNCLSLVLKNVGRHAEALMNFEGLVLLFRELGDRRSEAVATGNCATILSTLGRHAEARACDERALEIHREIGYRLGEAMATANLGFGRIRQGRLAEAQEYTERALVIDREIGYRYGEGLSLYNLATLLREQGEVATAEERLRACLVLGEEIGSPGMAAATHLVLGSIRMEEGDEAGARESLGTARDLAVQIGAIGEETLARCHLACLPGGDVKGAMDTFTANEEGLDVEERREARRLLWKATGDRRHLTEAKRLLDEAVAIVPEDFRASMLANVRANREIVAACEEAGS